MHCNVFGVLGDFMNDEQMEKITNPYKMKEPEDGVNSKRRRLGELFSLNSSLN
jgi:hypothetical protein